MDERKRVAHIDELRKQAAEWFSTKDEDAHEVKFIDVTREDHDW